MTIRLYCSIKCERLRSWLQKIWLGRFYPCRSKHGSQNKCVWWKKPSRKKTIFKDVVEKRWYSVSRDLITCHVIIPNIYFSSLSVIKKYAIINIMFFYFNLKTTSWRADQLNLITFLLFSSLLFYISLFSTIVKAIISLIFY